MTEETGEHLANFYSKFNKETNMFNGDKIEQKDSLSFANDSNS